jgi:hypothetical protein
MENVLPALLAFVVMMVTAITTVSAADRSIDNLAESWKQIADSSEERTSTRLEPVSAVVDGAGTGVTIVVDNVGGTTIADFSRIDVIVEYTPEVGPKQTVSLVYVVAVPGPDEWTVTGIDPDAYDPRMVNPGEAMELTLTLANAIASGESNRAIIVAPNGASTAVTFTR